MSLREFGMYHRDVKPANAVWGYDKQMKLTDFGCAFVDEERVHQGKSRSIAGSPHYMAPELLEVYRKKKANNGSSQKNTEQFNLLGCDLYSVGMTMMSIIEPKLKRDKFESFLDGIIQDDYKQLYQLVKDLLDSNPNNRIQLAQ